MQVVDVCQEVMDVDLTGWKVRIEGNGIGAEHQTSTSDLPTFLNHSFNHIGVAISNAFNVGCCTNTTESAHPKRNFVWTPSSCFGRQSTYVVSYPTQ